MRTGRGGRRGGGKGGEGGEEAAIIGELHICNGCGTSRGTSLGRVANQTSLPPCHTSDDDDDGDEHGTCNIGKPRQSMIVRRSKIAMYMIRRSMKMIRRSMSAAICVAIKIRSCRITAQLPSAEHGLCKCCHDASNLTRSL